MTLLVGLLSGCVTTEVRPVSAPFDPAQLAPYRVAGRSKITGQAFLKTKGGDVKLAAGEEVTLIPAIPFIKEVRTLRDQGISPVYPESTSEAIRPLARTTIADAQGNFEFSNLPAGEYLLEVLIKWQVARSTTGGMVSKFVVVGEDDTQRVMLTW